MRPSANFAMVADAVDDQTLRKVLDIGWRVWGQRRREAEAKAAEQVERDRIAVAVERKRQEDIAWKVLRHRQPQPVAVPVAACIPAQLAKRQG